MALNLDYTLREAVMGFKRTKLLSSISIGTISLLLLLLGGFLSLTVNVQRVIDYVRRRVEIEVFLEDSVIRRQALDLKARIMRLEGVRAVTYISKEQALKEFKADLELLEAVETNPLPASLRIRLKPGYKTASRVETIVGQIEGLPGVEEVVFGGQWLRKLDWIVFILSGLDLGIGIIISLVSIFVISNTIRLTLYARRESIEIMKLVGATEEFISRPFMLEGMVQGILGGVVAAALLYAAYRLVQIRVPAVVFLPWTWVLALVLFGGVLAALASQWAAKKFLQA